MAGQGNFIFALVFIPILTCRGLHLLTSDTNSPKSKSMIGSTVTKVSMPNFCYGIHGFRPVLWEWGIVHNIRIMTVCFQCGANYGLLSFHIKQRVADELQQAL